MRTASASPSPLLSSSPLSPESARERFMDKIFFCLSGCWLWTGALGGTSKYGRFWFGGRMMEAHRFSWWLHTGKKCRADLDLHHAVCGWITCVNPRHLKPVTPTVNQRFKRRKYCRKHLEVVRHWSGGQLRCRKCHAESMRRYRSYRLGAGRGKRIMLT